MKKIICAILPLLLTTGCMNPEGGDTMNTQYTSITPEQAAEMIRTDQTLIVVDVRRKEEYEEAHLKDAVLIPNETIGSEKPKELPDFDQKILIYCRSGVRAKQAAQKLVTIGYTDVYEFGGIIDWKGETVSSRGS